MKRGRPSLGLNETGQMWVVRNDNGTWTAKQWLRGTDGRRRQVTASGRTRREATDKLTAKLAIRPTANARGIQPDWTITELGAYWLDRKARVERTKTGAPIKPQTLGYYDSYLRNVVIPHLGQVRLHEIDPPLLETILAQMSDFGIATDGPRTILNQMLKLAVRDGAIATNPLDQVPDQPRAAPPVDALTPDQARDLLARLHPDARRKPGRRGPTHNLSDIATMTMATGARIGEVLALTWNKIDLTSPDPTVRIDGTLIEPRKDYVTHLHRQESTKTDDIRVLHLPDPVVDILHRRRATSRYTDPLDPVLGSKNGTWIWPANLRDDLRTALEPTPYNHVTPHTLRRTVATHLAHHASVEAAQLQLGHKLGTGTITRYIAPTEHRPDQRHLLTQLLPTTR
ncbi:tyrosine-type recombinase/integrase [Nocardioides sp.]|uniref:tyrosine-type recombinase/integrase n=1 Tax=Nocardioides sp. TaxID=35761 RepID=UPI0035142D6F